MTSVLWKAFTIDDLGDGPGSFDWPVFVSSSVTDRARPPAR